MGCDIHICIQRQEASGEWREVVYQTALYDHQVKEGKKQVDGVPVAPSCFRDRNYDLFGILANVRNGTGFAGIQTGEGWPYIAEDRGFPVGFNEDSVAPDPLYAREYDEDGPRWMGDHSFTWVGLDELRAFPWDLTSTKIYGVVPADEYERLKAERKAPTSYSGAISGQGIQTFSEEDYAELKRGIEAAKNVAGNAATVTMICPRPYVRMSWTETAREATNDWPGKVIPWLEELAAGQPLRLVFGFDS